MNKKNRFEMRIEEEEKMAEKIAEEQKSNQFKKDQSTPLPTRLATPQAEISPQRTAEGQKSSISGVGKPVVDSTPTNSKKQPEKAEKVKPAAKQSQSSIVDMVKPIGKPVKVTKTFYLNIDTYRWIEESAAKKKMSTSVFLSTLINLIREQEKGSNS